jgi:hypothetical protein
VAYLGMAALAAAMPLKAGAQSAVRLQVIDSATRQPLPNAEIAALGRRGLTNAYGAIRFAWPDSGSGDSWRSFDMTNAVKKSLRSRFA